MDKVKEAIFLLSDENLLKGKIVCEMSISSFNFIFGDNIQDILNFNYPLKISNSSKITINISGEVKNISGDSIIDFIMTTNNLISKRKFMLVEVEDDNETIV